MTDLAGMECADVVDHAFGDVLTGRVVGGLGEVVEVGGRGVFGEVARQVRWAVRSRRPGWGRLPTGLRHRTVPWRITVAGRTSLLLNASRGGRQG